MKEGSRGTKGLARDDVVSRRLSALELLNVALDDGSFVRWDTEPVTVVADEVYAAEMDHARAQWPGRGRDHR